ncbi:OprO/OprP family phosphate-selective porin [Nitrosovibrio tenuis]|uniref:Phosphate-selective porin O and P n=1 Tax=Nitrosovibrio tenuis TaxID=1233 RepID=A0A1H7PUX6_9PROT|nr:OprO/OprP family phosphate-selective porin [Nitrosovibrio tenuis]SEL39543.1 Phosphate-selective porin O and P [Nitrosovibrio tenuis]
MSTLFWGGGANAQKLPMPQNLPQNLQIHGFASQSWLKSSDNNVFGKSSSDSGSFDFRELGLNASMRPLTNLQFSVQGLSRWAGKGSTGNIRLDYGFVDYTYYTGENGQLGIRLGRMKNPLGFYNDTRDVPFTRPSILLPQSIYFDRTRKLAIAADGMHLYGEYRSDLGDISFQGGVVRPLVRGTEAEAAVFGRLFSGHLTPEISYVSRVNYELDGGRIRFAVSATQLNMGFSPGTGDVLKDGSVRFTPLVFSAQYNAERWSLTAEYALRHLEYKNFGPALPNMDFTGESYYFQGAYRITPEWEGIVRYDVLYTDGSDPHGTKWAAARAGRQAYNRFAKDITVGLRWSITPEFMLRAEYHRVNGTGWLSTLDNPVSSDLAQHWNLFSILGSYRF